MLNVERQSVSRPQSPPLSPPQLLTAYSDTKQKIKQMNESSKLVRSTYVKVKLTGSRDWTNWSSIVLKYMTALEIQDILEDIYEIPEQNTPEHALYKAQKILLRSFILW